ncbi:tail fiber assembly protein [Providencia alcalifaciens]|uniref:tail fiber assembly protein n=1 Tax=Providencia alcalifaciens TaxID=126385 RepID=UPI000446E739|nr:tail fiber assembly protein [Providencia alcalifaciens]EUD08649.1 putative tail fiber assembly protein [Providencia alcalifaciens R90-1475]
MKMTYYKNKKTGEVFAYDDKQLSQVARLIELESLLEDTDNYHIESGSPEHQLLKAEYNSIPLGFFDIRENINVTQKMTEKEVDAHINPPKSKEHHISEAKSKKQLLLAGATEAIAPLQDAVDLGMATEEEIALLNEWKECRVLLNRVDTSLAPDIDWPQKP